LLNSASHMKVSIITICYNSVSTLEATIQSVLQQDYPHLEYIIIDGASNDGTLDIIEKYRSQIATVVSEKDKGIYDAMNKGLSCATGDLIGILNSDDTYAYSSVISDIVQQLGNADSIYADLQYVDAESGQVKRNWISGAFERKNFLLGWMPPHPTFFVRSNIYQQYGSFIINQGSAADYEMMLRLLYKHEISANYLPKVITLMKTGGASNVSWKQRIKANRQDRMSWKINGLQPKWYTLWLKPLRKITQFF
jgi:glycosyltransferase involved in cell wall biosynthesis